MAKPNDWTKQVHVEKASKLSGKAAAYLDFWAEFLQRVHSQHPSWTTSSASSRQSWITLPYGKSNIWYGVLFSQTGPAIELYFGSSSAEQNMAEYNKFLPYKDVLEERFGEPLVFEPLPDKKACRIRYHRAAGGDVLEFENREAFLTWFIESMERLRGATQHVKSLIAAKI